MGRPIQWTATIEHVREVSLLGCASLSYWSDRLQSEELRPSEFEGKAQVLLIAAEMKFMGIWFRELSFSILVQAAEVSGDAALLLRAHNSCQLFAVAEGLFFSKPYQTGDVRVSASIPTNVQLVANGQCLFRAEMAVTIGNGQERKPSRAGQEGWNGPVFLPRKRRDASNLFIANLQGQT